MLPVLRTDVVVSWMDPITGLPGGPRFGANNDYIAWLADGWDADWTGGIVGSAPRFNGSAKIGASELNRPEDVEWNPASRRLFPALTKHGRKVGLKQNGTLAQTASGSTVETARRVDDVGSIWTLVESNPDNPAVSDNFSFWPVWFGSRGDGPFDAANPDDLLIDRDGGLIVARPGPSA